jgi:RNase H-fold protein (predicted Holliday junction resolvase)
MLDMNMKKSRRREKGMVDQLAATMMLQEYLSKS